MTGLLLSIYLFITRFYWDVIRWRPSSSSSSSSPWCSSPWRRGRRRGTSCCTWTRTRTRKWRREGEGWWGGGTAGCPCSPAAPSPGRSAPRPPPPPPPPPPTSKSSDQTLNKLVSQFLSNLAHFSCDDYEVHSLVNMHHHTAVHWCPWFADLWMSFHHQEKFSHQQKCANCNKMYFFTKMYNLSLIWTRVYAVLGSVLIPSCVPFGHSGREIQALTGSS